MHHVLKDAIRIIGQKYFEFVYGDVCRWRGPFDGLLKFVRLLAIHLSPCYVIPPAPSRDNTKRRRNTTGAGVKEEKAACRRKIGVSREVGVVRTAALDSKDPGRGGSEGYPIWYRRMMIDLYEGGHAVPKRLVRSIRLPRWDCWSATSSDD